MGSFSQDNVLLEHGKPLDDVQFLLHNIIMTDGMAISFIAMQSRFLPVSVCNKRFYKEQNEIHLDTMK